VGAIQQDRRTEVAVRPDDVRTHIGVRLAVVPLSGVVAAIRRTASKSTIHDKLGKSRSGDPNLPPVNSSWKRPVNRQFEDGTPGPPRRTGRQQNQAVNWRRQRVRKRNPGVQAQPWGFGAHPKPDLIQPENA
jgi:hypothetical protein